MAANLTADTYPTVRRAEFKDGWWPGLPRTCHGRLSVEHPAMTAKANAFDFGRVYCEACGRLYAWVSPVGWRP